VCQRPATRGPHGKIPLAAGSPLPLGERLVVAGHLSKSLVHAALREQRRTGDLLGKVLVNLGFFTEEAIEGAVARDAGGVRRRL